jgi:8-amino-7-oxononanoate synthase
MDRPAEAGVARLTSVLEKRLAALEREGLRRHERVRGGGVEEGTACSNLYLGLDAWGAGASRLVSGSRPAHRAFERDVARWLGTEDALLFNSGYNANVGAIPALAGEGDAVFSDALNHASIIDGIRLGRAARYIYPHSDMAALEAALARYQGGGLKLIVTESVFSMDGDVAPLAELVDIAERHDAVLYVDEAHAIGVLGPNGRGALAALGLADRVPIQVGTCGKAIGGFGAWVAGPAVLREYLYNRARSFVFTTALPEQVVEANRAGLEAVIDETRQAALARVMQMIASGLERAGWWEGPPASAIFPLIVGPAEDAVALARAIEARGFFVQAIRPPTVPVGTSRLRLTAAADYDDATVDALVTAISDSARALGIAPRRSSHGQQESAQSS